MTERAVALLATTLLAIAACGGGTAPAAVAPSAGTTAATRPTTGLELSTYQGADRQRILEAGARAEGKLTWYTSLAGDIIDKLADGFKKQYPYVAVDVFRGAENEIVAKATQEAQAGQQVFDVAESPPTTSRLLYDASLLTPFYSPSLERIPDTFKSGIKGQTVESATVRMSFISFGYNTKLLPESAVPKTLDDLMKPELTGKIAIAGSTTGKRWLGTILHTLGDDKGQKWLTDFATKQKPAVQQLSGKALLDLIAKGEVVASTTIFRDHVDIMLKDNANAPVKWVALDPIFSNAGQAMFAAKAPHPNAGLLFLDYLLSDGQRTLQSNGYTTASEKVPFTFWIPEEGRTTAQIEKDVKSWDDLFARTFRK